MVSAGGLRGNRVPGMDQRSLQGTKTESMRENNGQEMSENKKEMDAAVQKNRILIVTGGKMEDDFAADYLKGQSFTRIIAADSGLAACRRLAIVPTDILGDFDSLKDKELLNACRDEGIPVREFPSRKDYTDTELAVEYARELSPDEVVLLGATGSRYDHALANIGMLERLADEQITGSIVDRHNEIEMLCGYNEKVYRKREDRRFFSLVAWGGPVTGISLTGFSYPLSDAELSPSQSLGISNELTEECGVLRMKTGRLLVIRSSD